ncbi:MAG: single-stranded-DNA-specific exonuclease RecJ [Trueperaceae bacterium]|nr:single-stranded-DNA-specific exonuclease RecJ [Trueperaceae bacterium]
MPTGSLTAPPAVLTQWQVRPAASPKDIEQLCRDLQIPPLLASILWSRGLGTEAVRHLNPPLALTQIPDLDAAAERLELALKNKKRILIHGDYDADGITGTAVLCLGLRALGGNVIPFIPDRLKDGYGIHPDRVEEHISRADLFLTVDCGITNLEEIKALQAAGVEVIVSDHHQPGTEKPQCLIVHPKMSPLAKQGLPELTGAGVAYHLLWALHKRLGLEEPKEYSDIATIGTIADVAPLLGENRALINEGLSRLADSKWPGLRAAVSQSRLDGLPTARDVAFILAPRLNAAGRLGEADKGLELLMTPSERRARELAVYLDTRNNERRKIQDEMFELALTKCDPDAPALILDDPNWHPGVMGIVASNILERYYKPVFIIAQGKGSVRSTPGISAVKGLTYAAQHLKRFGGHSQAAGFAIKDDKIEAFKAAILDYVGQHPSPVRSLIADAVVSAAQIDDDLYKAIQSLEPFGEGHPSPLLALTDKLDMARAVGQTKTTLQLRISGIKGVAWRKGDMAEQFSPGETVSAVVSLRENTWNGQTNLEFIAEDLKQAEPLITEGSSVPQRFFRGHTKSAEVLRLEQLPLAADLLIATHDLSKIVEATPEIYFDLKPLYLHELETQLAQYPQLGEVRKSFVFISRGQALPFSPEKSSLIMQILEELELLKHGRALRGQKRNPYSSETLIKGLLEHYKLQTFINAYKYFDDASFDQTVANLFG